MSDLSPVLSLPYLQPSQAQKHVTHNEALRRLDVLVQLAVLDRDRTTPPGAPAQGDRHIVAAGASGAWAGQDGAVAIHDNEVWLFLAPLPGWRAEVLAEGIAVVHDGSTWVEPGGPQTTAKLGVNTGADDTNRLSVASPAVLFNNSGDDQRVKINKATATDTASLLFQTGFSGRAEMGTAGSDGFSFKVSADGSAWTEALTLDPATGIASLPQGAQVDGALTGTAVQQAMDDTTAGRLLPVGAFGLGAETAIDVGSGSLDALPGGTLARFPVGATGKPGPGNAAGTVLTIGWNGNSFTQIAQLIYPVSSQNRLYARFQSGGVYGPWAEVFSQASVLGAVAQSGGVPSGALIERGSNANGAYVRLADGTQICTHVLGTTAGTDTTWTLPAAFVDSSFAFSGVAIATSGPRVVQLASATTGTAVFAVYNGSGVRAAHTTRLTAIGRWF